MSKRILTMFSLALCAACAAADGAAAQPAAPVASTETLAGEKPAGESDMQRFYAVRDGVNQTKLFYEEILEKADGKMRAANVAFQNEELDKARDLYVEVKNDLSRANTKNLPVFNDRISQCTKQIEKTYEAMAFAAMRRADAEASVSAYDEAVRCCEDAIKFYPECKDAMERKIADYKEKRNTLIAAGEKLTEDKIVPDRAQREYQIQILMQRGREMAVRGQYVQARDYFQQVLDLDPYRADATQNLQAMNIRLRERGDARQLLSHDRAITQAQVEWLIPSAARDTATENVLDKPVEKEEKVESPLEKKLRTIIIPSMDAPELKIPTVVKFLRQQSIQHDPDGKGVNIFLRSKKDDTNEPNPDIVDKEVTILKDNVSLGEAINMLCVAGNLQSRLERNAVIIEAKDARAGNFETKIFPIDQTAIKAGDSDDALKAFFIEKGVPFPAGANVVYEARISRLIATNTPENLALMEELLNEMMSKQEPLVQLLVRIILINQNDLNQLAFNYNLSGGLEPNFPDIDTSTLLGGTNTPAVQGAVNFGDYSFQFAVQAINQIDSKDVLASPRVVTLPENEVSINFVRKLVFVEDYDDAEENRGKSTGTGSSNDTYDYVGPFPNFESEPTPIGIQLTVNPKVDVDARTINMVLNPKYSDLTKWYTFAGTTDEGGEETMKVPNISVYEATTEVTVKDGETIVLGGIVDDTTKQVLNKVPFLGDIPLIGRLFQNRQYRTEKKTMLIFVTPTLVKPDGTPYFPDSSAGGRGVVSFY